MSNTNKPKQYYWFTMVLYPDNARHLQFVEKVLPNLPLRVIGIKHDRDSIVDDEVLLRLFNNQADIVSDEVSIVEYEQQQYKKEHLHIILKLPMKRTLKGMQQIITDYGIEERFIQPCDPFNMCAYLTHASTPHKYQYSPDEVWGDIGLYTQYTTYSTNHEFTRFYELILNIDEQVKLGNIECNYLSFCYYIHANGMGHVLTGKGNFMYNTIIKEKIKEIKDYGLYYTIPSYGKINI